MLCIIPFYAIYYAVKRWSGAKKPIAIGLVGVGLVLLIVGIVSILMPFAGVKAVITEFMEAGAATDVEAAYACWSPQWATEEDIAEYIESRYDDVFAGYKRLTIHQRIGQSIVGITTCSVSGSIIYAGPGDPRSSFQASLVKENDVWKITNIYIGY